jgi:hypothetical protein
MEEPRRIDFKLEPQITLQQEDPTYWATTSWVVGHSWVVTACFHASLATFKQELARVQHFYWKRKNS